MSEILYELKQDASIPTGYWRAGKKLSEKRWREIFNIPENSPFSWFSDWFIDLTPTPSEEIDRIKEIVNQVFTDLNLHSISYKEAAEICVRKALIEFCKK